MNNHQSLEEDLDKKFLKKDIQKKRKMKVTGKNIFKLKKIITSKYGK
ncbi:hypothetical protein HYZ76_01780 [Candidatus Falkowbacteria bacterium]|nr:hypothetical protein [Candidatus Falkowbacteria bacterium]